MAEFYLPAAELIAQPVFVERRNAVAAACQEAGKQAVSQGSVDQRLMDCVADVRIARQKFREQADWFWEALDGKGS